MKKEISLEEKKQREQRYRENRKGKIANNPIGEWQKTQERILNRIYKRGIDNITEAEYRKGIELKYTPLKMRGIENRIGGSYDK